MIKGGGGGGGGGEGGGYTRRLSFYLFGHLDK